MAKLLSNKLCVVTGEQRTRDSHVHCATKPTAHLLLHQHCI